MHAQSSLLYSTLWDTMDHNPSGSSVHGIFPDRILEWAAMPNHKHVDAILLGFGEEYRSNLGFNLRLKEITSNL